APRATRLPYTTLFRSGAEGVHDGAEPVQGAQRGGDAAVLEVALEVEGEGVPAQEVADGAGLDPGEVHAVGAEDLERLEQGAGAVVRQLDDDGGLVGTGAGGDAALAGDEDEAGDRPGVVLDALGEDGEAEVLRRQRRADGGTAPGLVLPHRGEVAGRGGGGGGGGDVRAGDVRAQPALHLRLGMRVGGDGGELLKRGRLAGGE